MDEQTRALIDRLRAANEARTPGDWNYGISGYTWNVHKASDKYTVASVPYSRIFDDDMALKEQDAAFIALCSRAVPALLAELDSLQAALESQSLREQLAALEHERWSGWMHYMFNRTAFNDDGTWTMPAWAVERWTRQMNTPYAELTEREKDSDRAEADKTLAVIVERV